MPFSSSPESRRDNDPSTNRVSKARKPDSMKYAHYTHGPWREKPHRTHLVLWALVLREMNLPNKLDPPRRLSPLFTNTVLGSGGRQR